MLKGVLRYIRQKPKVVRNQYALALSSLFTAVVVFFWLASGASGLGEAGSSIKASEGSTPFSNLIKQAKDQFASTRAGLTKVEQTASGTATSTPNSPSGEMILTEETHQGIDQNNWSSSTDKIASSSTSFGFSGNTEATTTSDIQYIEVQIVTTTTASSTSTTSPQ